MKRLWLLLRQAVVIISAITMALAPLSEAVARRGGGDKSGGGSSNSGSNSGRTASDKATRVSAPGNAGKAESSQTGRSQFPTRSQRIRVPPKAPPKDPPPKPPKPPSTTKPPRDQPPKRPNRPRPPREQPPRETTPRPPRRPPIIVLPTPPRINPPPLVSTFLPPNIGPRRPNLPPLPPQFVPRPRRAPLALPPAPDLTRSREAEIIMAVDETLSDGDTIVLGQGLTLNVEVQYRSSLLGAKIVRLRIPDNRQREQVIAAVIQAVGTDPRILAIQPNFVFEASQSATPASLGPSTAPLPQYATEKVRLNEAHRTSLGRDVRVAVIDTGMDGAHPELAGAVAESFDAIGEGPVEVEAHGTAIAGIVAARQQMRGMAPNAHVLAIRSFSSGGGLAGVGRKAEATTLTLIKGLDWAAANAARVVNMSFAGPKDPLLQAAIEAAQERGLIMVAAAGNGGPSASSAYPAAFDRVIAVTASDSDDQVYNKANRGTYVAVAAPGVDILTPAPKAAYDMSSGTSLAAAHVSGIIALMLERKPNLTAEAVRAILSSTARDPDRTASKRGLGAGIVDAARAVAAVE